MKVNKIVIINGDKGNFAFTKDDNSSNFFYQAIGENNQFYFSTDSNEGGNLNTDWDIVNIKHLDREYIEIAKKSLNN